MIAEFTAILATPARQRDIVTRGARRDRREVRRRPAHRRSCRSTATCRWRTSSPRRTWSSPSPAAATPSAPGSTHYRSQQRGGKGVRGARAARRGHRRALLHDDDPPLAALLHQPGPRLPRQGLRAAGGRPRRQGPARRQPAGVPAGRADRPGARVRDYAQRRLPRARHQARAWSRRPGSADYDSNRAAAASSRSTCATATSWSAPAWPSRPTTCSSSRARASRCASTPTTRRCARWAASTSGVTGMKFRDGDALLAMSVVARGHRPRRVRRLRDRPRQAHHGLGVERSRAAAVSASRWPSCPTRAATSSGR